MGRCYRLAALPAVSSISWASAAIHFSGASGVSLRPVGRLVRHIRPVLFWSPNMAAYDAGALLSRDAGARYWGRLRAGLAIDSAQARPPPSDGETARLPSKHIVPVRINQPKSYRTRGPGVRAASRIAVETSEARTSTSAKTVWV